MVPFNIKPLAVFERFMAQLANKIPAIAIDINLLMLIWGLRLESINEALTYYLYYFHLKLWSYLIIFFP